MEILFISSVMKAYNNQTNNNISQYLMSTDFDSIFINRKFLIAILSSIIICFEIMYNEIYLIILISIFWIPQILHNILNNSSRAPSYFFILTHYIFLIVPYCIPKLLSLKMSYNIKIIEILTVIIISNVLSFIIIVIQKEKGPRYLVPYFFDLAQNTNYSFKTKSNYNQPDCPICLSNNNLTHNQSKICFATTPCNHTFHFSCLNLWMKMKQECPMCRTELPSLDCRD